MKNVILILTLFLGMSINGLMAQNCTPCPVQSCAPKCCKSAGVASASTVAMPMLLPVSLTNFNTSPQPAGQCAGAAMCTKKEMKACQAACQKSAAPACVATQVGVIPTEIMIDQQYHETPKPTKG